MTTRFSLLFILLLVFSAWAETLRLGSLKVGTTTYSNVTILGANATDLYFRHSQGFANVKLKYVGADLQKRFDYDPRVAEEAEKRQSEEDFLYQSALAKAQAERSGKANGGKNKASLGLATGLADPVSEKSLLGKPAPKIEVDKWLSEKPALEGKFVLISFWAPWSAPCRQCIPELNALQKKYANKMVVVGVSAEAESEISEMPEPRPDFASAIDSKAKMSAAAAVTSIPQVLLCDPSGTVLYQGHPGALTEKKLEAVFAAVSE